ncbi:MAG: hypothetical protein FWH24_00210 [Oscillospiraceae bacterium]|nr:hypothetical protein [Oscillospiraceae bacterium]
MFDFFKNILGINNKNNENSAEYRLRFAERIKDKKIKYISERVTDGLTGEAVDTILGKDGFFNINKNNELEIYLSGTGKPLFKAYIPDLAAYEFLSLEGAVLESLDLISGKYRQIIAYYKYYR